VNWNLGILPVAALALMSCETRGIGSVDGGRVDSGSMDVAAGDAPLLRILPGCENVQFTGSIRVDKTFEPFADALQEQLQFAARGQRGAIVVDGASDSKGLDCFDGLVDTVIFWGCKDPLRITSFPKGASWLSVDKTCTVADISGIMGVSRVSIQDASLITDFSPLAASLEVEVDGDVPLESIAPYVQGARSLHLDVNATSLAPLASVQADHLWVHGRGLHSVSDFVPSPTLTCFDIELDASATDEERMAVSSLCTPERNGRQCPAYNCCWPDDCGPGCIAHPLCA
jgi:hypothetical protein